MIPHDLPSGARLRCIAPATPLISGKVYTLKSTFSFMGAMGDSVVCVHLEGVANPESKSGAYVASRFILESMPGGADYQAADDCDLQVCEPFTNKPFNYQEAARRDIEKAKLFVAQFRRET